MSKKQKSTDRARQRGGNGSNDRRGPNSNTKRGREAQTPRNRLTKAERARVCILLNRFRIDPDPILRHAKGVIIGDRRSFLLTDEDKKDIVAEYALRVHRYLDDVLAAGNPWAYMKTMVRRTIYDYLRHRRFELRIVFRRRARVKQLLGQLELNNAQFKSDGRDELGKQVLVISVTASQARDLRSDTRVESLVVLHDGVHTVSVDDVSPPDPDDDAMGWQVREDLEAAHRELKRDMPVPAEVFDLRLLQNLDWKSVAASVGFTSRHCRELLKQYLNRMRERFPELRDYLGDFGRGHT